MHFWWWLSMKIQKHKLFVFAAMLEIIFLLPYIFFEPEWVWPYIFPILIARGFSASAAYLLPPSLVPDVIEIYTKIYQQRQEATFYGAIMFVEKMGIAFTFGCSSWALGSAGYYNPSEQVDLEDPQTSTTIFVLRLLVGLAPMIFAAIACFFAMVFGFILRRRYKHVLSDSETDYD
jgi:glycoside/pentoside/hexuronide:cation symporter, GPH family